MIKIKAAVVALSVALLWVSSAQSGQVTFEFSGQVARTDGSGAGFSHGDHYGGTFSYDESAPLSYVVEPNTRALYSTGTISVVVSATSFSAAASPQLQIFNDWSSIPNQPTPRDNFFLSVYQFDPVGSGFFLFQIDMLDVTALELSDLSIPPATKVLEMSASGRLFIRRFSSWNVEEGLASGSLRNVQLVPEPSTWVQLFAGFAGLALVVRSRRARAKMSANPSIERTHNGGAQCSAPSRVVTPLCAAHVKR